MIDFRGTRTLIREFNDLAINIGCQKIALTEPRFQFEYAELKNQAIAIDNQYLHIRQSLLLHLLRLCILNHRLIVNQHISHLAIRCRLIKILTMVTIIFQLEL